MINLISAFVARLKLHGKISAVSWVLLPLGVLLFMMGFFMSGAFNASGKKILHVGDIVNGSLQRRKTVINFNEVPENMLDRMETLITKHKKGTAEPAMA